VRHLSNKFFTTLFSSYPLPTSGKCKFSIQVDNCSRLHPKLYVGVASEELKDRPLSYKPGFYFINTFSRECFLNNLCMIQPDSLAAKGQVITVVLDLNKGWIIFEIDNVKIMEGRLNLSKTKPNVFYPFVSLGEDKGKVSFVLDS